MYNTSNFGGSSRPQEAGIRCYAKIFFCQMAIEQAI